MLAALATSDVPAHPAYDGDNASVRKCSGVHTFPERVRAPRVSQSRAMALKLCPASSRAYISRTSSASAGTSS